MIPSTTLSHSVFIITSTLFLFLRSFSSLAVTRVSRVSPFRASPRSGDRFAAISFAVDALSKSGGDRKSAPTPTRNSCAERCTEENWNVSHRDARCRGARPRGGRHQKFDALAVKPRFRAFAYVSRVFLARRVFSTRCVHVLCAY